VEAVTSLYRRPLPGTLVPFSSPEGRVLFREALDAGTLESFFPLIEQFHTQSDPAYCGLGSLVMALNALGIDPGRAWRGPWRWFSEELLDCCAPLERVQTKGLSLDEVACLARCNGANAALSRPRAAGIAHLRADLEAATRSHEHVMIVSYARGKLGQTGAGHHSPVGGYHRGRDLALILDVARFKYPPHWVDLPTLFSAMQEVDPATTRSRGWLVLTKRSAPSAVSHFLVCPEGIGVKEVLSRMLEEHRARMTVHPPADMKALLNGIADHIEEHRVLEYVRFRAAVTQEHTQLFERLSAALAATALYRASAAALPPASVVRVVLWCLAMPKSAWLSLPPGLAAELAQLLDEELPPELDAEVALLHSQVEFLLEQAGLEKDVQPQVAG
jgi:glutathione gamma-glutamylcysteinyltransferase